MRAGLLTPEQVARIWPDWRARDVVYRDEDVIVVDKPPGVPSQAAEPEHDDDVVARLKRWLAAERGCAPDEVYLGVHQRLDRATSGLLLYALRREVNGELARQFEGRTVLKRYQAVVQGRLGRGDRATLRHMLAPDRGGAMRVVQGRVKGAREAITELRVLERNGDWALLSLELRTGRKHQLRVQLASGGAPIVGDALYGGAPAPRLMLHACELGLAHPHDGRELRLRAEPPPELAELVRHGRLDPLRERAAFERALEGALQSRYRLSRLYHADAPTRAFRLFHRAADGCDAIAVDLYGEHLVLHVFDAIDDARLERVLDVLDGLGLRGIYLKHHPRQKNELGEAGQQALAPAAPVRGEAAADELVVEEHGLPLGVSLGHGFSTGIFLDQRDNRARVRELARGKRVLNLFAYTGGFSLAALAGGAQQATCVDASRRALERGRRNVARIGATERHRSMAGDAFEVLARMARRQERFDLVVLDPPSYSSTRGRRFRVLRDYASLVERCAAVLAPGGQLLACINHHEASRGRLRRDVRHGTESAGRVVAALRDLPPGLDFPAAVGREPDAKAVLATLD